jgi:signal peptidase I
MERLASRLHPAAVVAASVISVVFCLVAATGCGSAGRASGSGCKSLVVRSGSMSPTIQAGWTVFYKPVNASQVRVGDLVVFKDPQDPAEKIVHRVYAIDTTATGKSFVTKGDANGAPDPWTLPATGTVRMVVAFASRHAADRQAPACKT